MLSNLFRQCCQLRLVRTSSALGLDEPEARLALLAPELSCEQPGAEDAPPPPSVEEDATLPGPPPPEPQQAESGAGGGGQVEAAQTMPAEIAGK
jgi:hypothetical protein